jgi:hypothetical protein
MLQRCFLYCAFNISYLVTTDKQIMLVNIEKEQRKSSPPQHSLRSAAIIMSLSMLHSQSLPPQLTKHLYLLYLVCSLSCLANFVVFHVSVSQSFANRRPASPLGESIVTDSGMGRYARKRMCFADCVVL